jgi:thiol-disulfide isomerase/thioredoxin
MELFAPVRHHTPMMIRQPPGTGTIVERINEGRRRWLGAAAMTVAGAGLGLFLPGQPDAIAASRPAPSSNPLLSLSRASAWLNSPPLTAAGLRGKVVLIDVWTYTCINWLRTLPRVRAWAERYEPHGLVVIGVHAPEFAFEHDLTNVRRAVKEMRIEYPVAIDNEFAIWRAFRNQYWPALYIVDSEARIRYQHFGEGEYAETEHAIQRCLADTGARDVDSRIVSVEGQGIEAEADWASLKSPENYVGYERTTGFASGNVASNEAQAQSVGPVRRLDDEATGRCVEPA